MENKESNTEDFKRELKQLLKKYHASIGFDCSESSDLYGVHGEYMYIRKGKEKETVANGWNFNHRDL